METVRVDIVSDVVCPWCIVGYRQLREASEATGVSVEVYWHPFELNPDMVEEGENLRDHIMRKYGTTEAQSISARQNLTDIGAGLGIAFNWSDESRIYNTFAAHQLLHWAAQFEKAHALKLAMFEAYFTEGKDVSNVETLITIAHGVGLDDEEARRILAEGDFVDIVREKQQFWRARGVQSVPTMVFDAKQATSGAIGAEAFARLLSQLSQR